MIEQLRSQTDIRERLAELSDAELEQLLYDWPSWARPNQLAPALAQNGLPWATWLILAGRGFGKALALDTPIPTPDGWTNMGNLRAGDIVFDESGAQTTVLAAHPIQDGRPCFRVRFSDGSSIIADEDHLWTTQDRRYRKAIRRRTGVPSGKPQCKPKHFPRTVTTREIADTLYDGKEVNHCIPCASPLQTASADLPIDPYLLGLWLGDGSSAGGEITTEDSEMVAAFELEGFILTPRENGRSGNADTYSIACADGAGMVRCATTGQFIPSGKAFCTKLRDLGLINHKRIPPAYFRASEDQRLALLQGLFDTDGHCSKATGASEFCNTKSELAYGVLELAISLGFKATMCTGRAMLRGVDCGPKYRVLFTAHDDRPIFRLKRKIANQPKRGPQAERAYRRYIVAVESVPSVPVRCITVDSPSRLYLAGESMIATHNTRVGAEKVREWKRQGYQRVNFIAPTADDLRDVMIEGESGILAVCPPIERPVYRVSKRRLEWPDGSISLLFSAQEPERLRGKQHDKLWGDEPAAWRYQQECWDQAMLGLRLGNDPQIVATTTPKPTKLIRELLKDPTTAVTRGTTYDNKANLAPTFYTKIITKYEGTRLGRQELNAEVLDDNPGALFKRSDIEAGRIKLAQQPVLVRTVVAIDPAVTSNEDSDETGMITVGIDRRDPPHFYVVEDTSNIYTPDGWAKMAVKVYHQREADRVVGEVNNGGDMIEATLRHQDQNVSYKSVRATKGKEVRAEPVAALYEQHRVHHVGNFAELEDQMVEWNPQTDKDSPDRMDALVWGITELAGGWDEWAGLLRHYQNEGETTAKVQPEPQQPVPKADGVHPAPPPPAPAKPGPVKAYERAIAAMTPQRLCAGCKLAIKESDSVTSDGFQEWHEGCNKPSWAS